MPITDDESSESDLEASQNQVSLQRSVEELLEQNREIMERVRNLEDSFDARTILTRRQDDNITEILPSGNRYDDTDTLKARQPNNRIRNSIISVGQNPFHFAFEKILEESWVYRRNERNDCDCSMASTARRSHSWSIFSGLSLADISILSVIALPINALDISNGKYYDFGPPKPLVLSISPNGIASQEFSELSNDDLEEIALSGLQSDNAALLLKANLLEQQELDAENEAVMNLNDVPQAVSSGESSANWNPETSNARQDSVSVDDFRDSDDDEAYPCRGCGEVSSW